MPQKSLFGSSALFKVLADLPMTCLDIGSRHGFTKDLLPIAPAVDAYGFEPDPEECQRLNQNASEHLHPWRSLRYIPIALGRENEVRSLNLYRKRGCSSFLLADQARAETFSRGDYYQLDKTIEVRTTPLDEAAVKYQFNDAVYMKIDIEGAELEVFTSGRKLLTEQLLAIRTEVSFFPLLVDQPLFKDVDAYLRDCGFMPMDFIEVHRWRRTTKRKHPYPSKGPIPYSRGQLVHADMLYFRDPTTMPKDTPQAIQRLLKAGFLALVYEYVDHALALFTQPAVAGYLRSNYGVEPISVLKDVSRHLARRYRRSQWRRLQQSVKGWVQLKLSDDPGQYPLH
jgi:FkbM family methyltransferase